ncbi:hypothetical protein ANO14919_121050 [Xylariales sp. No.14919]|nr:hypothetical protein ANO14919_121050 [Xylariales sp. No.14919]
MIAVAPVAESHSRKRNLRTIILIVAYPTLIPTMKETGPRRIYIRFRQLFAILLSVAAGVAPTVEVIEGREEEERALVVWEPTQVNYTVLGLGIQLATPIASQACHRQSTGLPYATLKLLARQDQAVLLF